MYVPAVGKCSFHPLWVRSSSFFSPASSNLAMFAQTVCFSWSCARSTRPFHVLSSAAPPHALPRAARGLVLPVPYISPPPRAARVEGASPELVCPGSSLLNCLVFLLLQLHFLSLLSLGLYHSMVPKVFNTTSVVVVRGKTSCVPSPSSLALLLRGGHPRKAISLFVSCTRASPRL